MNFIQFAHGAPKSTASSSSHWLHANDVTRNVITVAAILASAIALGLLVTSVANVIVPVGGAGVIFYH